jgi:hypothetical protein
MAVVLALACLLLVGGARPGSAAPYPPLPIALDRSLLGNLTGPTLTPGASGGVTFTVSDPFSSAIAAVLVTLDVYAFNGFPGNDTSAAPVAGAPTLTTPASSGPYANVSAGTIAPHAEFDGSVGVVTSASTPSGAFAVRLALSFTSTTNGTVYRLESRGWFSAATWAAATELPNGSATLNLSVLGVSGVVPETTVYVATSAWDWVLASVLVAALVLVGAGAWVYFRRGPGSTSGTR